MSRSFHFTNPEWLWLLFVLLPLVAFYYWYGNRKEKASLRLSSAKAFLQGQSFWIKIRPLIYIVRLFSVVLLIIALARPRVEEVSKKLKATKGIDIIMAVDVSASMLAKDLKPNRLEALKEVAKEFVNNRPNDRIGMIIYSGESYTKTPLTSDKSIIDRSIDEIKQDFQLQQGTAIGLGMATAVNRLKDSKAKSKVIILLTDGENNAGFIDPRTSAELAYQYSIKTYTIGIGTNGMALSPVAYDSYRNRFQFDRVKVNIDEDLLKFISKRTGGKYFRATDNEKLEAIYGEINKLEKTDIEEFKYYSYDEYYRYAALCAGILVFLEMLMRYTIFRSFI